MTARLVATIVGLAAMLGAVLALTTSLGLGAVDRTGEAILCGNGFRPEYDIATQQDKINLYQHNTSGPTYLASNYVQQCGQLVRNRRITAAIVGGCGGLLLALVVATTRVRWIRDRRSPLTRWPRYKGREHVVGRHTVRPDLYPRSGINRPGDAG